MYCISDEQIEFILSDISARGVELEGLQLNLLDHICCIIEQELEENGDFRPFYEATIRRFYKERLSEIEDETHLLLTNKNYYVMKKVMISSGVFAATSLSFGIFFKYMHWAGASILITLGIGIASLVFLPLIVTLKVKEQRAAKDKLLIVLGSISAIAIALGILFKVQHWPGANMLGVISPAILALVFLPIYFFSGIRNPETKVNTIVSSALIIIGCGLFFTLTITSKTSRLMEVRNTAAYLRSTYILKSEEQAVLSLPTPPAAAPALALGKQIYLSCEELRAQLVAYAAHGATSIGDDFEDKNVLLGDATSYDYFSENPKTAELLTAMERDVKQYNAANTALATRGVKPIPASYIVFNQEEPKPLDKISSSLNDLIQIQMMVLQNQRAIAGSTKEKMLSSIQ